MDFWCSILEVVRNDQILDIFKGKPWVWDTRQREEWRMMAGSLARATGGIEHILPERGEAGGGGGVGRDQEISFRHVFF